jgi:GDPmannose 4,6-dehydratase
MNRALILGSGGQDGRILFDRLNVEGCPVIGVERGRLRAANTAASPAGDSPVDLLDPTQVAALIERFAPDEVYYLAAYHQSSEDRAAVASLPELMRRSLDVHVVGLSHVLEAMHLHAPGARLFYAASSHIFGDDAPSPQDETTPINPSNAYAITKAAGLHLCRLSRREHGVFASVGILYNHESPLRSPGFLTQRIIAGVRAIRDGRAKELVIGDASARVDWGYAPDYVDAMARMLRSTDKPDDFIVASGIGHTVGEFIDSAFRAAGIDPGGRVREEAALLSKPRRGGPLIGNAARLRAATGWRPSVSFDEMIALLVNAPN